MRKTVEIVDRTRVYDGHFKVDKLRLRHALFRGGMGDVVQRELFERGHAAAVLPYDPVADAVVLIEQFRVGAHVALGDGWVIEVVAGMIDGDEGAEDVARREAVEEAGVTLGRVEPIGRVMATPGGSSECFDLFCGEVDSADAGGIFGLDEEGEDIRAFVEPWAVAAERLRRPGLVMAAPALMALQWLALNREGLRRRWR